MTLLSVYNGNRHLRLKIGSGVLAEASWAEQARPFE